LELKILAPRKGRGGKIYKANVMRKFFLPFTPGGRFAQRQLWSALCAAPKADIAPAERRRCGIDSARWIGAANSSAVGSRPAFRLDIVFFNKKTCASRKAALLLMKSGF
jgi:hypothetical protein